MSLLRKALSRVETRPLTPAVEPLYPAAQPINPVAEPIHPAVEPVFPQIDHTEPLIEPVYPEIEPLISAFEPAGPLAEAADPAYELPNAVPEAALESVLEQSQPAAPSGDQPPQTAEVEAAITPPDLIFPWSGAIPVGETCDENQLEARDESASELVWQQFNDLQELVTSDVANLDIASFDNVNSDSAKIDFADVDLTTTAPPVPATPPMAPPLPKTPATVSAPTTTSPLNVKPEFRELRNQLLSRLNLSTHPTLLLVDAGREVGDAAWLLPLAASIIEKLNALRGHAQSQILLVEGAGPNCGLAQALGLDTHLGFNHVLNGRSDWPPALQSTLHPQIKLLGRGAEQLQSNRFQHLAKLWAELTQQFDLLLVATGPIGERPSSGRSKPPVHSGATLFLPLASAAILCLELNGTSPTAATNAKRLLDAHGIPVLGCIVQPN